MLIDDVDWMKLMFFLKTTMATSKISYHHQDKYKQITQTLTYIHLFADDNSDTYTTDTYIHSRDPIRVERYDNKDQINKKYYIHLIIFSFKKHYQQLSSWWCCYHDLYPDLN